MDWSTLVFFSAARLALTATSGPDMLLIVSRSATSCAGRWPQYLLGSVFGSLAAKLAFDSGR